MITQMPISDLAQMYVSEGSVFQALILVNLGFIVCVIYTVYHKSIVGKFVNALFDAGAVGADNAVSLEDIGYDKNRFIIAALRRNKTLAKYILQTDGKYYIGTDASDMMKTRYKRQDADFGNLLLTIVLLITVFVIIWVLIPWLVERLNSVLQTIS